MVPISDQDILNAKMELLWEVDDIVGGSTDIRMEIAMLSSVYSQFGFNADGECQILSSPSRGRLPPGWKRV